MSRNFYEFFLSSSLYYTRAGVCVFIIRSVFRGCFWCLKCSAMCIVKYWKGCFVMLPTVLLLCRVEQSEADSNWVWTRIFSDCAKWLYVTHMWHFCKTYQTFLWHLCWGILFRRMKSYSVGFLFSNYTKKLPSGIFNVFPDRSWIAITKTTPIFLHLRLAVKWSFDF